MKTYLNKIEKIITKEVQDRTALCLVDFDRLIKDNEKMLKQISVLNDKLKNK